MKRYGIRGAQEQFVRCLSQGDKMSGGTAGLSQEARPDDSMISIESFGRVLFLRR